LHEKGINQWTYPWNIDYISEDVNKGRVYLMLIDGMAAGTFSIKDTNNINVGLIDPNNNYLCRIAILPEYQGQKFGMDIIRFSKEYSRNNGKSLYLDCWAGNRRLRDFYSGAGFEHLGDVPEDDYFISVFKWHNYRA
jgi:GNAT superfamily N-acetyltransferase